MKIVGLGVCGEGEADRYMRTTLDVFKRLCDDAIIVTNNASQKEKDLIKEYGYWQYEDNREWGLHQPTIKTELLKKILKLKPDWIIPLDMDEEMLITRDEFEKMTEGKVSFYCYIVNMWNDLQHYAKGLSFFNIRAFKNTEEGGTQYLKKPVHCGLAPPYYYQLGTYVPIVVKHYGLMKREDRMKKVERYKKYDPRAIHKGRLYYNALSSTSNGVTYNEEEMKQKVINEVSKYKQKIR